MTRAQRPEYQLAEFQQALRNKAAAAGTTVDVDSWGRHIKLIREELRELDDAIIYKEPPENVLKELADLLYVVYGAVNSLGYTNVITPAFNRVHENNLSKILRGNFNNAGKLVKPVDHKKVDLKDLVEDTHEEH